LTSISRMSMVRFKRNESWKMRSLTQNVISLTSKFTNRA
jgi:hypothetical protein